jgi:hypothetical protein
MLNLVFLYLSSHYQSDLLPRYELVSPKASTRYVQTVSNDVTQSSQLVSPLISRVCHCSKHKLFLCIHKSIVACTSQLQLVVGHVTF